MKLKKSTIVLIVLAVIFLGLSVVSTKYSVTRTITAIDEIGDMKLNDDSIDRFKKAAEYYQALDPNQNLEEKITNLKTYKEARLNYARLMIKQASLTYFSIEKCRHPQDTGIFPLIGINQLLSNA